MMGMDPSRQYAMELIDNALKSLDDFDDRAIPLREIASYIITRNH